MTYQTLVTNFERELLFQIIYNMRQKKLSSERARKTAKDFLPVLRSKNAEEFIESLSRLSRTSPEVMEAFIKTVKEYEKEKVIEELIKVRIGLKGGEIHGN